jgi:agmatinase
MSLKQRLTKKPKNERSFCGVPFEIDLDALQAEVAILGIPFGTTYDVENPTNESAGSPAAIRARSGPSLLYHHDFDIDAPILSGEASDIRIVDCGDVDGGPRPADGEENRAKATAAVRAILNAGAVPIVFGGDDSVPIPFFAAFEGRGPFTVVQVDAHLDWRDELHGSRFGYSSPMRRASEMDWITGMVQIGLRGTGSARPQEVADARAWGSRLVTAREVREQGMAAALQHLPEGGEFLVTIDCDGIDPADFPAASSLAPGGIAYPALMELINGIAGKGRIAGFDIVEFGCDFDLPSGLGATVCARLAVTAIGVMIRSGQFDA